MQGFDINQEEARLILGAQHGSVAANGSAGNGGGDVFGGIGDAMIGAEAVKALADGFNSRKDNLISTMGDGDDLEKILQDEMLDSCDTPAARQTIKAIFMAVFFELCQR